MGRPGGYFMFSGKMSWGLLTMMLMLTVVDDRRFVDHE